MEIPIPVCMEQTNNKAGHNEVGVVFTSPNSVSSSSYRLCALVHLHTYTHTYIHVVWLVMLSLVGQCKDHRSVNNGHCHVFNITYIIDTNNCWVQFCST